MLRCRPVLWRTPSISVPIGFQCQCTAVSIQLSPVARQTRPFTISPLRRGPLLNRTIIFWTKSIAIKATIYQFKYRTATQTWMLISEIGRHVCAVHVFTSHTLFSWATHRSSRRGITFLVRMVRYHRTSLHSLQLTLHNDHINLLWILCSFYIPRRDLST